MKKLFLVLSLAVTLLLSYPCMSNVPGPTDAEPHAASATQPVKKQRALAGGLLIIMSLGVGYSAKKIYLIRSLGKEEI